MFEKEEEDLEDEVSQSSNETEPIRNEGNELSTVYVIRNGVLDFGHPDELKRKNYFYRLRSLVPGVDLIDYDKTDIRPLVKDNLNRMDQFLEIKYLKGVVGLLIFIFLLSIGTLYSIFGPGRSSFDAPKTEIIDAIKKLGQDEAKAMQSAATLGPNLGSSAQQVGFPAVPAWNPFPQTSTGSKYSDILPGQVYKVVTPEEVTPIPTAKKKTVRTVTETPEETSGAMLSWAAVPVQTTTTEETDF